LTRAKAAHRTARWELLEVTAILIDYPGRRSYCDFFLAITG
jgi:hypothetical protein